ncbi:helix-turn-helix domain-containing protein [Hymenobacter convexus]|uniref:helix-turn-helix domain-containing protein n=1 Tax=Hymenobacter sp. CA1UV-4 TaxID=3063782 RepID=UPI002713287E|nr:AraC family transcriptional regulator [Hymenobacter sp. CA1UV-4]MDO7853830.1 AraC family transcriptional regulator [Hymenobacter sp. CA1UV-4]
MPTPIPQRLLARQHEITADFLCEIDRHLADIVAGRATEMFEIRDFAGLLCIHPTHLSNTIKLATGHSPCYFFEERILELARQQLRDPSRSVADIATGLTYDPSNFTKFFKRFQGSTPKQYREQVWAAQRAANTEAVTI